MLTVKNLLSLDKTIAAKLFEGKTYPWEVLGEIGKFTLELGATLGDDFVKRGEDVWIHKTAVVAPSASISGPCIIDANAEIRHCAYIRGKAIIGKGCVIGNSVEVKNAVIFDLSQVPHFNYVGDSVLGYHAHLGAGAIISNLKSDKTNVTVMYEGGRVATGQRKFGAILGDFADAGCNAVLFPGAVIGRHSVIYPLSRVRGYVPENSIFKDADNIVKKTTREA